MKDYVILIDDANCFDGSGGYPTLFELYKTVEARFPGYEVQVFDSVILIRPAHLEAERVANDAYVYTRVHVH